MPALQKTTAEPRPNDSEKVTINLGHIEAGQIELLVLEGFYANRSDFIRTAIRNLIDKHAVAVEQAMARRRVVLGLHRFTKSELEALLSRGEALEIRVLGLAVIEPDVPVDLARATILSVSVLGAFQCSAAVKSALSDRMS
ncbi:MAG: CopG family transcriptional regulator [Pseudotabrizicola sp.]|uniref:CopG family transcriptional regulator n=1 Tax=Pseudotabrizicola sp. TaxID=2939647 RepID=UPI0027312935|nr:CopG family transcriptional regulator [Pseudotabrizicola sp.]MDP2082404.1 CopG family transcriptional regulator [Pseudotabrizicola sp.]MDZ7574157.1 CopG family transcriptional regulator [Pseudotabrizicola sp.]